MTVAELEAAWTQKYNTVRSIAISIATERSRGNEAGVAALRPYFDSNVSQLRTLTAQLDGADMTAVDRWIMQLDDGVTTLVQLPAKGLSMALAPLSKEVWVLGIVALAAYVIITNPGLLSRRRQ